MVWVLMATILAVAVGSTVCARLSRPDRNYWPMMRVIWSAWGFAYAASAIGLVVNDGQVAFPVRLAGSGAMLVAVVYAARYMARRNRTPRFIELDIAGDPVFVPLDQLEYAATIVESWANHGAMPTERADRLRAALAEAARKDEWKRGLAEAARRRRADRGVGRDG